MVGAVLCFLPAWPCSGEWSLGILIARNRDSASPQWSDSFWSDECVNHDSRRFQLDVEESLDMGTCVLGFGLAARAVRGDSRLRALVTAAGGFKRVRSRVQWS